MIERCAAMWRECRRLDEASPANAAALARAACALAEAWIAAIPEGRITSIVARENGVIGTAIVLHELSWSRHVGELRVLVSPAMRGKGLGRLLIQECFVQAFELGLTKLCVQMTVDQRAAIASFESIGFRTEALFRNHVKDHEGKLHDLAVAQP